MADEQKNKSEIIRNYAIAGFFVLAAIPVILLLLFFAKTGLFVEGETFGSNDLWTNCEVQDRQVSVFVNASKKLDNVKCTALDQDFFEEKEVILGFLGPQDSDVCRFMLKNESSQPPRFEISYNGKTRRQACSLQNSFSGTGFAD